MALNLKQQNALHTFTQEIAANKYTRADMLHLRRQCEDGPSKYNEARLPIIIQWLTDNPAPPSRSILSLPKKEIDKTKALVAKSQDKLKAIQNSEFDLLVATKLHQLKHSATTRNKEFNLSFMDVKRILKRRTCFYTGLQFDRNNPDFLLTVDRVDSKLGYIRGNVVACLNAVNAAKEHILEKEGTFFKDNPKLLSKMLSKLI